MPKSWRKYLTGILLVLAICTAIGWLYGKPEYGLLVAALLVLAWQLRQLLIFENTLRQGKLEQIPYGDSIWSQMLARVSYLKQRNRLHKKQFRGLLKEIRKSANALPDGAIILSNDHEVLHCNKAATNLAGFKRKRDRGQRVENILRSPEFIRYLNARTHDDGVEIKSPVHEDRWLHCRLVPYGADQSLLLIRDVTEAKRISVMRREFASNASHELRSPLTVITGYLTGFAEDPDMPEIWQKPMNEMQKQALRMNNIVAELLELSRLESSDKPTAQQIVDVSGILSAVSESVSELDDAPAIDVELESQAQILGSNVEIQSIIGNLVSNAVRHTPADGAITLRWRDTDIGADLDVIDTGEGIAEDHISRLTERFFRVDSGRSREDGGIGLGLAIVKHALARHDALLEINSKPGEGSRFTCHFPASRIAREPGVKSNVTKM